MQLLKKLKETLDMLKIYERLGKDLLAIPFVTVVRLNVKICGVKETYVIEALMLMVKHFNQVPHITLV